MNEWALAFLAIVLLGALVLLVYGACVISSGVYVNAFCGAVVDQPVVALTFDDGPEKGSSEAVLDLLREYGIKATFFCIGRKLDEYPNIALRMHNEGHLLGNHSYRHTWKFPLLLPKAMQSDLTKCTEVIERITGQKNELFRPPFGVTNPTIAKAVKKLNLKTVGWDLRTFDTSTGSVARILQKVKQQIRPGSVILLHDSLPNSKEILEGVLQIIQSKNYIPVRIDELMELKNHE